MIAAAGLLYLGLFALAASMNRHQRALAGPWHQPGAAPLLAPGGWLLILCSLIAMLPHWQGGIGLVSWIGLLPLVGGLLLLGLSYRPRCLVQGLGGAIAIVILGIMTGA
ncbi:DUF3325 family protein [Sphingobium abikonense]|uniref:DUF3325 family protein n=1 Tax=Sphingobium abikonense TaxID=86193 RepID=UPI0035167906